MTPPDRDPSTYEGRPVIQYVDVEANKKLDTLLDEFRRIRNFVFGDDTGNPGIAEKMRRHDERVSDLEERVKRHSERLHAIEQRDSDKATAQLKEIEDSRKWAVRTFMAEVIKYAAGIAIAIAVVLLAQQLRATPSPKEVNHEQRNAP